MGDEENAEELAGQDGQPGDAAGAISDAEALLKQIAELQAKLVIAQGTSPSEDAGKDKGKEIDPIHGKYADSLKKDLGIDYNAEWDKIPLADRIKTMEIALSIKRGITKREKQKEGKIPPGAPTGDAKPKSYLNPQRDYKAIREALFVKNNK